MTISVRVGREHEIVYEFVMRHRDRHRAPLVSRGIPGYLTKRKSNRPERRAFVDSHRLCSSEIQVDVAAADLTRTTARLSRLSQATANGGQVRRSVPSSSISFKVIRLSYPTVLKVSNVSLSRSLSLLPSLSERRRCLIPLNLLLPFTTFSLFDSRGILVRKNARLFELKYEAILRRCNASLTSIVRYIVYSHQYIILYA